MASISSMKMMAGAFSFASRNTSLTIRGPSPKYFWTNSEPTTRMNAAAGREKIGETQLIIKITLKPFKVKCIAGAHHVLLHLPVVWWATALANMVLPQPGGPYIRTPLGGSMPIWGKSQKAEYDRVVRDKKITHVTSFVYICCTVIVDKHLHAFLPPSGRSCVLQSTCIPQWVFFKLSWS